MASNHKIEQRIAELQSKEVKARKDAALWLGRKRSEEALLPLLAALQDSSWKVRRNAAIALGDIGDVAAVEPLIACLSDRTLSVRRAAIQSLGSLHDLRAADSLMLLHRNMQLGTDAVTAMVEIGAPALLYCCQQIQSESLTAHNLGRQTAHQMIRYAPDALLKETMRIEDWSGQQRWLVLETVRKIQSSFSFLETWNLTKFSRISDIPNWCERITRDEAQSALHAGSRQVLDYIMLGRASQRDFTAESEELLRAAEGTKTRDTGKTLLRASDKNEEPLEKPSLLSRLRHWLGQEG